MCPSATSISSVSSLGLLLLWACSIWWAVCATNARLTDTSSNMLRSGDFRVGTWTMEHKNGITTQWSYNQKLHTHWLQLFQTLLPCHLLHFSINLLQFHGQLNSELHMEELTATLIKSRHLQHFTVKIGPSFLLTSHFHFILKFQELDLFWTLTMDQPGISIWNWNIFRKGEHTNSVHCCYDPLKI